MTEVELVSGGLAVSLPGDRPAMLRGLSLRHDGPAVLIVDEARRGVAILARTVFLESVGRYKAIFCDRPPSKFAQFAERVPMLKGRLDPTASTATGYAWLVWEKDAAFLRA